MYVVKLAVALTLVGGVRRGDGTTSTRGEPHLLLIGDPGQVTLRVRSGHPQVQVRLPSGPGQAARSLPEEHFPVSQRRLHQFRQVRYQVANLSDGTKNHVSVHSQFTFLDTPNIYIIPHCVLCFH